MSDPGISPHPRTGANPMITRPDLIAHLAAERGLTQAEAAVTVDDIFRWLSQGIRDHGEVRIHGFGTFSTKAQEARSGRNPRTGEPVEIPARKAVRFKASARLSGAVQ